MYYSPSTFTKLGFFSILCISSRIIGYVCYEDCRLYFEGVTSLGRWGFMFGFRRVYSDPTLSIILIYCFLGALLVFCLSLGPLWSLFSSSVTVEDITKVLRLTRYRFLKWQIRPEDGAVDGESNYVCRHFFGLVKDSLFLQILSKRYYWNDNLIYSLKRLWKINLILSYVFTCCRF